MHAGAARTDYIGPHKSRSSVVDYIRRGRLIAATSGDRARSLGNTGDWIAAVADTLWRFRLIRETRLSRSLLGRECRT